MKTMCPPGYHHNGFVATHALGHMMYGIYIYVYTVYGIYIYIYIYIYLFLILHSNYIFYFLLNVHTLK